MRNSRPQVKATVHVVAPRPLNLDKPECLVPVSPVIVTPSAPPAEVATHPIPLQFSPSFEMAVISSLINRPSTLFNMTAISSLDNYPNPSFDMPSVPSLHDSPRPIFVAGTANLLPTYSQSLMIGKVLFTPQTTKKHDYEYRVMFREDVLEVYPMLLTRRAADQTYFGYLEFTISRALSEKNYELADKLAAQYQREWDRLKPTGTRMQRPR